MAVDIDVNIEWSSAEIARLKKELNSLDDDLDIDLGLDGKLGDKLDNLSDTAEELAEAFDSFSSDLDDSISRLENLELDNIEVAEGNGDSGGDTGSDSGDEPVSDRRNVFRELVDGWESDDDSGKGIKNILGDLSDGDLNLGLDLDGFSNSIDDLDEVFDSFSTDLDESIGRLESANLNLQSGDEEYRHREADFELKDHFDGGPFEDNVEDSSSYKQALEKFHRNAGGEVRLDNLGSIVEDKKPSLDKSNPESGYFDDFNIKSLLREVSSNDRESVNKHGLLGLDFFDDEGDPRSLPREAADVDFDKLQNSIDEVFGDEFGFSVDERKTDLMDDGKIYGDTEFGPSSFYRQLQRKGYKHTNGENGTPIDLDGDDSRDGGEFSGVDLDKPEFDDSGWKDSKSRGGILRNLSKRFRSVSEAADGMTSSFGALIPNMQKWWSLIAVAIPALGAMAVQALGVAAAMGAMAGAGGALIGLGLIGHGDSMADSFEQAQLQVQELKKDLFETFQPTAQMFAPIQEEFFDFAPGQMERISRSMEGLTEYKDSVFDLFRGGTEFAADFIKIITENEDTVSQLTKRFAGLTGANILKFFDWLIQAADKNQDMLVQLGSIFKTVAISIYEVFMMISRTVIMLKPFFSSLKFISKLLNNQFFSGLLAVITLLYILVSVSSTVVGGLMAVGTALSAGLIPGLGVAFSMLQNYVFQALLATSASYTLANAIATVVAAATLLTGIGLAAWTGAQMVQGMKQVNDIRNQMGEGTAPATAGGNSPARSTGGTPQSSGNTVNNFKVIGDPDDSQLKAMGDVADSSVKETNYVNETRSTPSFDDV